MRRQVFVILLAGLCIFLPDPGRAQQGSTAAQFLKIGVDARAAAMGQAVVATVSDFSAMYWNPARLARLQGMGLMFSHVSWFAEMQHDFVGFAVPMRASTLGFGIITLNMGEIEITTVEEPMGTGSFFDASDLALSLSYARQMTDKFSVGVTAKYIRQSIHNEVANGIGFDIGTSLQIGYSGLTLAMALTNYGAGMQMHGDDLIIPYKPGPVATPIKAQLETQHFPLPTNFRIGIAFELVGRQSRLMPSEASTLLMAIDANHPIDEDERANVGWEYRWRDRIMLRAGYKLEYAEQDISYGFGLRIGRASRAISIDYAQTRFGMLGNVHQFSAQLTF